MDFCFSVVGKKHLIIIWNIMKHYEALWNSILNKPLKTMRVTTVFPKSHILYLYQENPETSVFYNKKK